MSYDLTPISEILATVEREIGERREQMLTLQRQIRESESKARALRETLKALGAKPLPSEIKERNPNASVKNLILDTLSEGSKSNQELADQTGKSLPHLSYYTSTLKTQGRIVSVGRGQWALPPMNGATLPTLVKPEPRPEPVVDVGPPTSERMLMANRSADLKDRIVAALGHCGPQKIERLAGLLVAGINPVNLSLAMLIKQERVERQPDGSYGLRPRQANVSA